MKMTIYLPDDLAERVKEIAEINVSGVCQEALRLEIARREALAKFAPDMQRHVVHDRQLNSDVAFIGKSLAKEPDAEAFLTGRGRIAVYWSDGDELEQFDTFEAMAAAVKGGDSSTPEGRAEVQFMTLCAEVARALGKKHVIELDI